MEVFNLADKLIEERQKNKELQEIIDKSIEYIEKNSWTYAGLEEPEVNKLLNILKGNDDNE